MSNDKIAKRYKGIQTFFTEGCLFFSLLSIAEQFTDRTFDCIEVLGYCKKMGYIDDSNDLTVVGQENLLRDLTGKQWTRVVMKQLPIIVPEEMYTIEKWVNAQTGKTHFKRRFVDTLENSLTVRNGVLSDYYTYSWR